MPVLADVVPANLAFANTALIGNHLGQFVMLAEPHKAGNGILAGKSISFQCLLFGRLRAPDLQLWSNKLSHCRKDGLCLKLYCIVRTVCVRELYLAAGTHLTLLRGYTP